MSAGGSTGGSDYVWIKLATAKEDVFAKIYYSPGKDVSDVAALACSSLGWGLTANKVRIHLVAVTEREPSEEEIGAAWATGSKPLAVSAGVASGAWLVAVPTTLGSSGGCGGAEEARSSISPRSVKSLESAHSMSREAEASVAFWTLAHAAFPGAALERVQRMLLGGGRPISNRSFFASDFPAFEVGRAAFVAATLSAEKPPAPTRGIQEIDFSGDYTKATYGKLEVDCLLKLPALVPSDWTRDPAALNPPIFIAPPSLQPLPVRPSPDVQVPEESAGSAATRSRFSVDYYPANSAMYVVGEVYAPLGGDNPLQRAVQKLLRAERTVQFLCAKEGKPVGDCVLGVVFLGPHIDQALASQLFRSLNHYRAVLPCLWALHLKRRLLGYHMGKPFQPAVEAFLNATAVAQLTQKVQQLERRWCSLM
jgi:hypothetical protein